MARRDTSPDFIEALARGLDVIRAFGPRPQTMSLAAVAERGWALTDEQLAPGIRSVAAPLRDGEGRVIASMNVTVHAAETAVAVLTGEYLPQLLRAAAAVSADWAACQAAPHIMVGPEPGPQTSGGPGGPPSVIMPATGPPALLARPAGQP